MVDKINDVVDIFDAHIRTQEGRLPEKISYFHFTLGFCKSEKILCLCAKFFAKPESGKSLRLLDYFRLNLKLCTNVWSEVIPRKVPNVFCLISRFCALIRPN